MSVSSRDSGLPLILGLTAGAIAGGLFLPLSLVYFTVLTDIPLPLLGSLVTLAGVLTLPLPVLMGWLVDRFGPRPFAVGAQALQMAAYLGFIVVREPTGVLLASTTMAVGSRMYWSTVFALVADHADARLHRPVEGWFAAINVTRTVGITIGGLLAGIVISTGGVGSYVGLAAAAAACAAVSMLSLLRVDGTGRPRVATRRPTGYGDLLRDRRFLRLLAVNAVFALSTLSLGLMLPTLVRSGLRGPEWLAAALLVCNATLVAVLGQRGGRLAARSSSITVLRSAAMLWVAAFAVLALAARHGPAIAATLLIFVAVAGFSVAEVLHAPASASLVNTMAGPAGRGRYLAVFQYSFVAAELVGPALFTSLFSVGHALPFLCLAVLNLLAVPALAALRLDPRVARTA